MESYMERYAELWYKKLISEYNAKKYAQTNHFLATLYNEALYRQIAELTMLEDAARWLLPERAEEMVEAGRTMGELDFKVWEESWAKR